MTAAITPSFESTMMRETLSCWRRVQGGSHEAPAVWNDNSRLAPRIHDRAVRLGLIVPRVFMARVLLPLVFLKELHFCAPYPFHRLWVQISRQMWRAFVSSLICLG